MGSLFITGFLCVQAVLRVLCVECFECCAFGTCGVCFPDLARTVLCDVQV